MSMITIKQAKAAQARESSETYDAIEAYFNGPMTTLSQQILLDRLDAIFYLQKLEPITDDEGPEAA